jgi:LysR family transcriptional regulator, salicylic acid-responsive activator of bsdBCD
MLYTKKIYLMERMETVMDIKQLRYFSTIAEEGQITRAAKKLHMAQPPLSYQLKSLEDELGVLLMERNGKNMELTEAGEILYRRAKELLHQLDDTITEVKEVGQGIKGILSIGSVKTCFAYIPERIRQFREQYPKVRFRLYEGDSFRLAQNLRNREIELAIVRLPLDLHDFSLLMLPADHFVVISSKHWPVSPKMRIQELKHIPLILLHRVSGVGLYELVIDTCRKHGFEPNVVCQGPDAAMLLSLARAGVGVALLPKSTLCSFPLTDLKISEIEDCKIESESAVIWLKNRRLSKAARQFLQTFEYEYMAPVFE